MPIRIIKPLFPEIRYRPVRDKTEGDPEPAIPIRPPGGRGSGGSGAPATPAGPLYDLEEIQEVDKPLIKA